MTGEREYNIPLNQSSLMENKKLKLNFLDRWYVSLLNGMI